MASDKIDKFEYILSIAQERNITKAAQRSYISQPAMTVYLNKLEKQLGVALFDRTTTPLSITYAGERYIASMQIIKQLEQDMLDEMYSIATNRKGQLSIGIGSTRGDFWLPYVVPEFLKKNPNVDICVVEGSSSDFENMLLNMKVDMCISPLPIYSSSIDYELLQDEAIILAVPQGHPVLDELDLTGNSLKNLLVLPPQRLNGQRFLCPNHGFGLNRITFLLFEKYGIKPGEIKTINNSDTAFRLACTGFGLVFTPICSAFPPLLDPAPVYCTLDNPPFIRKVVAAYHKNRPLSPFARTFVEITKHIVNTHPDLKMP